MDDNLKPLDCNDDDVLGFGDDTYKVGRFRKAVDKAFGNTIGNQLSSLLNSSQGIKISNAILAPQGVNELYTRWFDKGINCEILKLGSESWQKGKVRIQISIEFYVEESEIPENLNNDGLSMIPPESPLDDLRQMMKEEK
jgi:hypothetical protein